MNGEEQRVFAARLARKHALRFDRVVLTEHDGVPPALQDLSLNIEAGIHVGHVERGDRALLRRSSDRQRDAGDDPSISAPSKSCRRSGPADARRAACVDHVTVRQHGFEQQNVLDVAVTGRKLPRRPRRDPAADAAHADRLRIVTERESLTGKKRLGIRPANARVERREEILRVHVANAIQRAQIEHDGLRRNEHSAANAAPEAERDEWSRGVATDVHDGDDFRQLDRSHDTSRQRRGRPLHVEELREEPVIVATRLARPRRP